ncbi:succinyl-diaminopimelate desuccinylase [Candidatus Vidania fulgoroideorum]
MINFLKKIISIKTITPNDFNCQKKIGNFLKKIGFEIFTFKKNLVTNSIFIYNKNRNKLINILFSGHTDVVSCNNLKMWKTKPFEMNLKNGKIISRGSCDMKSSIVTFIFAAKFFLKNKNTNLAIILTSDEEGKAIYGTKLITKIIKKKKIKIINCLIGEPTSEKKIGDTIKINRRGSNNIKIKIIGKQGHSAYPNYALNSINISSKIIERIKKIKIKYCNIQTNLIKIINSTYNIIPGELFMGINIRYTSKIKNFYIIFKIIDFLEKNGVNYYIKNISNSREFYNKSKITIIKIINMLKENNIICDIKKNIGGTSDGRFLNNLVHNLFEIGMINKYAHHYNENIKIKDFYLLNFIYYKILNII